MQLEISPPYGLVAGSHKQGSIWTDRLNLKTDHKFVSFGLENPKEIGNPLSYRQIDIFNIGTMFPPNTIHHIRADFLFNGILIEGYDKDDLAFYPDILKDPVFPVDVKVRYENSKREYLSDPINQNNNPTQSYIDLGEIFSAQLQQEALRQLWRVLAPDGVIVVLDSIQLNPWLGHDHKIHQALEIDPRQLTIERNLPITKSDYNRSISTHIVKAKGFEISKMRLKKIAP